MKYFYLATATALLISFTARADESIVYGCRVETTHGTYRGMGLSKDEAATEAQQRCLEDTRNSQWQCSNARLAATCYDLTD